MEKFIDCINPVNNRVDQDPNSSLPELRGDGTARTPELSYNNSSSAIIDLPIEYDEASVRNYNINSSIPQAASINNFLEHRNSRTNFDVDTSRIAARRRIRRSLFHIWDNQLSLKLFGTKKRILEEQERQESISHWVIHPCSKFR